ncbi:TPA: membrane dipeptidase, partial [Klebsiella pneumoniae]|nr:membrane dipeptidase [Klebsiella pneumoniae]
ALGSDFDGITLPDELGDVAGLPRLINTLRASGYDQLVLDKLLWRNWLRVLKNVWQQ